VLIVAVAVGGLLALGALVLVDRRRRQAIGLIDGLKSENLRIALAHQHLEHVAAHDSMTGLLNRGGLTERLERTLATATEPIAVMFMDIDRFKSINDSLGHGAGDQLLQVMGRRITASLPEGCTAGRLGGDEFVVVMDDATDLNRVVAVAERLTRSIGEPLELMGRLVRVSASVGIAIGPDRDDTPSSIIGFANAALHRAKEAGRDRIEIFTADVRAEIQRRHQEERALRRSIDAGDVVPFFQPEFDASTGRLIGAEVLARWLKSDGSIANAAEMLTMAEDASTLERLTSVIMQQARPVIRRLSALGLPAGFRFRVNLPHRCTPRAWRDGQIQSFFTGIEPTMLTLDVYEAAVLGDVVGASGVLTDLRRQGARVCLEDAGRGGAALSMIRTLPLDEIRVDRQHVDALTSHPNDRAVVRAMVQLARDLGLAVSADGVETGSQADALLALGCTTHQGHLYARPMTARALEDLVLRHVVQDVSDGSML
jgi:diguanylate cyclase (GGDEF)-like protein